MEDSGQPSINCGLFLPDTLSNVNLVSVNNSTYTFSYTGHRPDVKEGYVLAGSDGYGYIRRIRSVQFTDNRIILETGFVSLDEFITNASLEKQFNIEISPDLYRSISNDNQLYLLDGVTIVDGGIVIEDLSMFENDNVFLGISEGYILFEPGYDFGFDIGWTGIKEFHAIATGELQFGADLLVRGNYNFEYLNEVTLLRYTVPIPLGAVGPILITAYVTVSFELAVACTLNVNGEATVGFDGTRGIRVGAKYEDREWESVWEPYADFNYHPFLWDQNADFHAIVMVRPTIDIKICGMAGPYLYFQPYLEAEAGMFVFSDWYYCLFAGMDCVLGFNVRFLSYELANYDTSIYSAKTTLQCDSSVVSPHIPTVNIISPSDAYSSPERLITVSGTIDNFTGASATMTINGHSQMIAVDQPTGTFSNKAVLISGNNTIRVAATEDDETGYDEITVNGNFPPAEIWVQLTWDANLADVDLYVTEPDGETSWFYDSVTSNGGELDNDDVDGYGPEHYYISEAEGDTPPSGNYEIRVSYFANHGWTEDIPVTIVVYRNEVFFGEYHHTLAALSDNNTAAGPGGWDYDPNAWWEVVNVPLSVGRPIPLRKAITFSARDIDKGDCSPFGTHSKSSDDFKSSDE